MKLKNIAGRIAAAAIVLLVILASLFAVFAVGEDEDGDVEVVTDEQIVTQAPKPTPAQDVTDEPIQTQPPAAVETEQPDVETDPPTDPETQAESEAATEAETKFEDIFKDDVVTEEVPTAVVVKPNKTKDLTYGYVSWGCVILGVLTIVIIIISNKSNYTGGAGKHRYGEGNKITGAKQRLLNDDYYTNQKYNSFYDKDIRR